MKETPIGLIIKEIANEKNLKVSELAELTGKSRQTIYQTFGRSTMSEVELQDWSKVFGMSRAELFDRWKGKPVEEDKADSNYLLEHLANLEEQFKRLLNQLDVKDRQIEKLMDLLGKPKDVMQLLATPILPMYSDTEAQA